MPLHMTKNFRKMTCSFCAGNASCQYRGLRRLLDVLEHLDEWPDEQLDE